MTNQEQNPLEPRLRVVETNLAAHISACNEHGIYNKNTLGRIERNQGRLMEDCTDLKTTFAKHISTTKGRTSQWTDTKNIISLLVGVGGLILAIIIWILK